MVMVFVIGVVIVVFIVGSWATSESVIAQTFDTTNPKNYTDIFHNEPQYILCESYQYSDYQRCHARILYVVHETNNSLLMDVKYPKYLGPVLDVLYKDGFKLETIIPDNINSNQDIWMYFRK